MSFKIGDKVIVVKTEFSAEEWIKIGKVDIVFKIGEVFSVKSIHINDACIKINGKYKCWYPIWCFELYDESIKTVSKHNKQLTRVLKRLKIR